MMKMLIIFLILVYIVCNADRVDKVVELFVLAMISKIIDKIQQYMVER